NFRLYSVANTYLWGKDFLISPVLQEHVSDQEVYFPKGSTWFDFYSGEKYKGKSSSVIELKDEYIPTFVRGGAISPMAKPLQTTQHFSAEDIELNFFFDPETKNSSAILFHDDGKTPETFESGD
ncbi:glycosyl hydrolase, partial [Salinimicrobium sp. CDJ15-91]|nr:glycosyl hydrolase [Salinimicrobium oceani]